MLKTFSINEINNRLSDKIDDVLANEMFKMIRENLKEQAQKVIYDTYEPVEYERRWTFIQDEFYTFHIDVPENRLNVFNFQSPKPPYRPNGSLTQLSEMIEYGLNNVYSQMNGYEAYKLPRPFIKTTLEILEANNDIYTTMKIGLKKRRVNSK